MSKALGPKGHRAESFRCTNSPITNGSGVKSKRGRTADDFGGQQMLKHFMIAASLLCAGCVSMGTNYDADAVGRLQVGMSKAQVVQMLGQPNQVITNSDGSERLIWVHSTGSMMGAKARSIGLPFGPDGRLTDVPQQAERAGR